MTFEAALLRLEAKSIAGPQKILAPMNNDATTARDSRTWSRNDWWAIAGLTALVVAAYFTRIAALPVSGEEGRWARGAVQMIETGDWIVPRQQGRVFPERPPLNSWAMALVGLVRGEVDVWAIRLPSVLAILLSSLVIYYYASGHLSTLGAFASASIYVTSAQVLEIGRMGESEAIFTFLVSTSLLLWHHGYLHWRPAAAWTVGYLLMALAALAKGPQAPAYFVAVIGVFLALRRDWKFLFHWSHALGMTCGLAVIAAWQVPFFLATDLDAVIATWAGLAGDRFTISGLISHVVTYPLETVACLLPWSPLMIVYLRKDFRRSLKTHGSMLVFLVTALAVTYPTVWFASGARGRYFMPLYPLVAVLLGLVVQRCAASCAGTRDRKDWNRFALVLAAVIPVFGLVVLWLSWQPHPRLVHFQQPIWFALMLATGTVGAGIVLWWSCRVANVHRTAVALVTVCLFAAVTWSGVVVNMQRSQWNDLGPPVAELKKKLPAGVQLVSFTAADHRFCYFYRDFIQQLDWPHSADYVPEHVEYFCINRYPCDTPQRRTAGRGRSWGSTSGVLPFAWEEVARVPCDRKIRDAPGVEVIVGRIIRDPADTSVVLQAAGVRR